MHQIRVKNCLHAGLLAGALLLSALIFPPLCPAAETGEETAAHFLKSSAYRDFQEKKYPEALSGIEALLRERPEDPYLIKMKGLTLMLMKKPEEAKALLSRAAAMNPADRQARLYLARLHMQEKNTEEAKKELYYIIKNPDPTHYYEDKAQRTLAVIEGRAVRRPAGKVKPWTIYGTYGYEYDDNVPLKSDFESYKFDVDRNASRFKIQNGLSYDFWNDRRKKIGTSYFFSQSLHTEGLYGFNFRNHSVQAYGNYFTRILDRFTSFGLKYTFSHGTLGDKTFSSSSSFLPFAAIQLSERIAVSAYDNMSVINFREKGTNKGVTVRDGLYNTAGVMSTFFFNKKKRSVSTAYEFGYNQTVGDDFDSRIQAARVTLRSPVIEKINLETTFSVIDDNHYNFSFTPHREDIRFDYSVRLSRPLGKWFEIRGFYSYSKSHNTHGGPLGYFSYSRNIIGTELSFKY